MDQPWTRIVTWLLVGTALFWHTLRCSLVTARDQQTPFLSANDRSRWCTVRSLVDLGTYEIDDVILQKGWNTIDKVYHRGRDGEPHYYSSKPPLYATILAVPYGVLRALMGWRLEDQPFLVGRLLIWLVNGTFLMILFWGVIGLAARFCDSTWAYVLVVLTVTWGTFLTTFSLTINNHLPAAAMVAAALRIWMQVWFRERRDWMAFAAAGTTAALAVTFELPALSFAALVFLTLLIVFPRQTLWWFVPPAAIVALAFGVTNWQAHGTLRIAYAHRAAGADWETGNWYHYPGSYWLAQNRKGVDCGEPDLGVYAFHVLLGHHGIWSLSPIWLVSLAGLGLWPRRAGGLSVVGLVVGSAVAVLWFYFSRAVGDRNYGGMTCGFRWAFWLIPLFLVAMMPAVDAWGSRRGFRLTCYGLLAISAYSALYPIWNPWQHPWLFVSSP